MPFEGDHLTATFPPALTFLEGSFSLLGSPLLAPRIPVGNGNIFHARTPVHSLKTLIRTHRFCAGKQLIAPETHTGVSDASAWSTQSAAIRCSKSGASSGNIPAWVATTGNTRNFFSVRRNAKY
jgi:hypothetical protein